MKIECDQWELNMFWVGSNQRDTSGSIRFKKPRPLANASLVGSELVLVVCHTGGLTTTLEIVTQEAFYTKNRKRIKRLNFAGNGAPIGQELEFGTSKGTLAYLIKGWAK